MVQKAVKIFGAFVFLILVIGIHIDAHYYGSELFSISLFGEAPGCCDEPCDLCHNEGKVFMIDTEFEAGDVVELSLTQWSLDFMFWISPNEWELNLQHSLIVNKFNSLPKSILASNLAFLQEFNC